MYTKEDFKDLSTLRHRVGAFVSHAQAMDYLSAMPGRRRDWQAPAPRAQPGEAESSSSAEEHRPGGAAQETEEMSPPQAQEQKCGDSWGRLQCKKEHEVWPKGTELGGPLRPWAPKAWLPGPRGRHP